MLARNDWFDIYAAAIMEGELPKIQERVTNARKAIANRIAQLEAGAVADHREPRDLQDALDKLQILLNVSARISAVSYAGPAESRTLLNRAV